MKNKLGLHVRPASQLAQLLQRFKSKVTLTYKGESINARSIMGIMILAAPKNAKVHICIEGIDAQVTMDRVIDAFDSRFGEEL